jgi:DNA polymerase III subunit gamma/tau
VRRLDAAPSAPVTGSPRIPERAPDRGGPRSSGSGPVRSSAVAAEAIASAPVTSPSPTMVLGSIEAVFAEAEKRREHRLAREIKDDMHISRFERGRIEFEPGERAAADLAARLSRALQEWSGERWMIMVVAGAHRTETVRTRMDAAAAALKADVAKDPLIAAILEKFPGSKIADIKAAPAAPQAESDEPSDNE